MERSACSLLSQIEQELSALRAQTVQNLEQKLSEREQQLATVSSRFLQLRQDFEYNLQLLDGRDAELAQYEAEVEGLQSGLEQQECLVEQLQASLAQAQSDLERERQLLQAATEVWQGHHERLVQEAAQIRQRSAEQLRSAAVEFEARQATVLADLTEARSRMEIMGQENARLQSAQEDNARQLAAVQKSAAQAQSSSAEASAKIEALQRSREAADREHEEATAQLERERRRLASQIALLEEERDTNERRHGAAAAQLRAELDAAVAAAAEAERKAEVAASSAAQQLTELRAELAQLSDRCTAHAAAEKEATEKLEAARKDHDQLEDRLKSHHEAETSGLKEQMEEIKRRHQKEVQSCKEAAEAESTFLRAKLNSLQLAWKDGGSSAQRLKEAQAALSSRDAELASLRAEVAALREGTLQADAARGKAAAAAAPRGFSSAAALRYSHVEPGWDVSEPESPQWLRDALEGLDGPMSSSENDAAKELCLKNTELQAALEKAQAENKRLCAALATLTADMGALSHALERPVKDPSPGVAELERQLAEAQRSVERLRQENERLMELSSELRAQRHKQERAAAHAGSVPQQAAGTMVPVQPAGRPQYPVLPPGFFGAPTPGSFQPYGASPLHLYVSPQYLSPHPFATPPAQLDPRSHQQPSGSQQHPASGSGGQTGKGGESSSGDGDKGYDADVAQRLRRIEALAEEIALAQVNGGQNRQRIANNRSSRLSIGNEGGDENAGVVGANTAAAKVTLPLNTASSRSTPSQRERLRAMHQKAQAPKVPRVRNWNIIDDQEALA